MSGLKEPEFLSEVEVSKRPFILIVVVWGREYIHKFLHYSLPTYLAPDNIPLTAQRRECEFLIVTSSLGKQIIEQQPIYKALTHFLPVNFVLRDFEGMNRPPHLRMSAGHQLACDYAIARGGYCVFLGPDYLLSDGSLAYLDQCVTAGARAVLLPGFRLIEEETRDVLIKKYLNGKSPAMVISGREMVEMILYHAHSEMKSYMVDNKSFTHTPNFVVWPNRTHKSLLVHAFHLHPLLLDVSGVDDLSALDQNTIDGDFVERAIDDWDDIEIVRDSDQAAVVSLTPRLERSRPADANSPDPQRVASWAYSSVITPLHRYYFTKAILFHCGALPDRSELQFADAARFVYETLKGPRFERWDNIGSVARTLYKLARRHARNVVYRQTRRIRDITRVVVNIPKYGVWRGRLIEHFDREMSLLISENSALRERLGGLSLGPLQSGPKEDSGEAYQSSVLSAESLTHVRRGRNITL